MGFKSQSALAEELSVYPSQTNERDSGFKSYGSRISAPSEVHLDTTARPCANTIKESVDFLQAGSD